MNDGFRNKVALVTGGSSGIGRAIGILFAEEGAKVVITADKNIDGGNETVQMIRRAGGDASFIKADISKGTEVESLVQKTIYIYGRLDCAVNNAGVPGRGDSEEEWDRIMDINLKGIWLCTKNETQWMVNHGGGAIVNVASIGSFKGSPGMESYCASKHGVIGLTKSAALAYAKQNIRVNAVCPGITDTPMTSFNHEHWEEATKTMVPMGRMAAPEEVARAAVWLCSDDASYITGVSLPVDGGVLAQ